MPKILNARCKVCNKVNSYFIETDLGDANIKRRFFRDDIHNDVVCQECKELHEELMLDYESQDDPWRNYSNDNSTEDQEVSILVGPGWTTPPSPDIEDFYEEEEA